MIFFQYLANGLILGGLYACIAVGFSLVWGVLNIINLLHGSFIVLGSYIAYFSYTSARHPPVPLGHHVRRRARRARLLRPARPHQPRGHSSVLVTLILTFGLELMMNNAMLVAFSADYRKVDLAHPLGIAADRQRLHAARPRCLDCCSPSC